MWRVCISGNKLMWQILKEASFNGDIKNKSSEDKGQESGKVVVYLRCLGT